MPTLHVWGQKDDLVPADYSKELVALFPSAVTLSHRPCRSGTRLALTLSLRLPLPPTIHFSSLPIAPRGVRGVLRQTNSPAKTAYISFLHKFAS
jgi:hypothetical protein